MVNQGMLSKIMEKQHLFDMVNQGISMNINYSYGEMDHGFNRKSWKITIFNRQSTHINYSYGPWLQWQTISLPEGIWFYMYFLCLLHHRLIFDADRLSHIWCTESSFSGYMMDVLDSVSNGYLLDMVTSPPMAKNYPQILEAPGRLLSST